MLKASEGLSWTSVGTTFHTAPWCSGSGLLIINSALWSKCLPLKLLGSLGGVLRNCSQLADEHRKLCFSPHIAASTPGLSPLFLSMLLMLIFALLNNCVLIIPPSLTLALQDPKGPIQFPNSQVSVYTTNANNGDTRWIFHFFQPIFDIAETHIDLPLFSPILSNYLDGKKGKAIYSNSNIAVCSWIVA